MRQTVTLGIQADTIVDIGKFREGIHSDLVHL